MKVEIVGIIRVTLKPIPVVDDEMYVIKINRFLLRVITVYIYMYRYIIIYNVHNI